MIIFQGSDSMALASFRLIRENDALQRPANKAVRLFNFTFQGLPIRAAVIIGGVLQQAHAVELVQ
jgi:hypothetical protein